MHGALPVRGVARVPQFEANGATADTRQGNVVVQRERRGRGQEGGKGDKGRNENAILQWSRGTYPLLLVVICLRSRRRRKRRQIIAAKPLHRHSN